MFAANHLLCVIRIQAVLAAWIFAVVRKPNWRGFVFF